MLSRSRYAAEDGIGNVRHWVLQHTLGGFFFRILVGGELTVGDTLTLAKRPHPEWTIKRVGDLMHSSAAVKPRPAPAAARSQAICGCWCDLRV